MNFQEYGEIIDKTYERITKNELNKQFLPAEEWIYDNYYVICENMDKCRASYKQLPEKLKKTHVNNLFHHMTEIVKKSNGMIEDKKIIEYFRHLNKTNPLTTKEINCVQEILRFALLGRLAKVCEYIESVRDETEKAENLFGRYLNYIGNMEDRSVEVWLKAVGDVTPVFAQTVLKLCAQKSKDTAGMRKILTRKLAGRNTSIDEIISIEHKNAISNGVLAGNLINSLRALPDMDWQNITCEISVVKQILRKDPAGLYSKMTDASADEYVTIIDKISKKTGKNPETVAMETLEKAQMASDTDNIIKRHVGYYLLKPSKNAGKTFFAFLFFTVFVISLCPDILIIKKIISVWSKGNAISVLLRIAITVAAVVIMLSIMLIAFNMALRIAQKRKMYKSRPLTLPALEFNGKLPGNCSVMIVVPCLLSSEKRVYQLISELEQLYFANNDPNICYTLLGDLPEAKGAQAPGDEIIHQACKRKINELNEQYSVDRTLFYYSIRERTYYEKDKKWMGYERKRGALIDLCKEIRHGSLPDVNFVLTIDAGTVVPRGMVLQMAQIMMHPMNAAQVKMVNNVPFVTEGYGLLEPSVTPLSKKTQSFFTRIMSDSHGFDIYGSKYSDFYSDIFKEGIYTGKGMFSPEIYLHVLEDLFPDNSILSHDLIEGSFLRCAFSSDIRLYDEYPGSYLSQSMRTHRWVRGDWQLLPYLGKRFKSKTGRYIKNPINNISRFKMIANLLSGLFLPAVLFMLIFGLLFMPAYKYLWIAIMILSVAACFSMREMIFQVLFLPHKAILFLDAIIRAIWRTNVSHLHMLEWVTSADGENNSRPGLFTYYSEMLANLVAAVLVFRFFGGVLSALWIASPWVAWILSRPGKEKRNNIINVQDKKKLTDTAYRIWKYYDKYADKSNNYLPPDNVQFITEEKIARRTSPTNIGFYMLAIIISLRFEFITKEDALNRLDNTLHTIEKLQKYKGHLYNWVDTVTLCPLAPLFISTVDSGNFIACCISVRQALSLLVCEKPSEENRLAALQKRLDSIIYQTDFTFLYDARKKSFSTGFNITENKLSQSFYDILASESRLTMYIAISLGQVPLDCYTNAARRFSGDDPTLLLSWSGTSFEYLLPDLFFKTDYVNMWGSIYQSMLKAQINHGKKWKIPWGVSESGFYRQDVSMNFKYKAHGVRRCALCADTEDSLVISAYSSLMAIGIRPQLVLDNLDRIERDGGFGEYGYYEAIDYSEDKINVVSSFMAHHLGMELTAICNYIWDDYVRSCFMSSPCIKSAEYLLAEKNNNKIIVKPPEKNVEYPNLPARCDVPEICKKSVGLYSNGEFTAMFYNNAIVKTVSRGITLTDKICITAMGGTNDIKNLYVYPEKVQLQGETHYGTMIIDCCVSAEDNSLVYHIKAKKNTVISIFTNLKMATDEDYMAHPAFCDMFVVTQKEEIYDTPVIIATKNNGREGVKPLFLCAGFTSGLHPEYDTDLLCAYKRTDDKYSSLTAMKSKPLEGNVGAVLNPCLAFSLKMPADGEIGFFIGSGDNIEDVRNIGRKYKELSNIYRAFDLSRTRCSIEKDHLNLACGDINYFFIHLLKLGIGESLIDRQIFGKDRRKLWKFGISGNNPLICVVLCHSEKAEELKRIMRMWCFYSSRGFIVDMALVCCDESGYMAPIRDLADTLVARALSVGSSYHGEIYVITPQNGACPDELQLNSDIYYQL